MTADLFENADPAGAEPLAEGAVRLRGLARPVERHSMTGEQRVMAAVPLRHWLAPGGFACRSR